MNGPLLRASLVAAAAAVLLAPVAVTAASPGGSAAPTGRPAAPAPAAAPAVSARQVVVSAHRGGAAYAPENTMTAFRNAVRLGVDELEADVQLTSDGVPVLLHDDTLDRTTSCTGVVSETTWSALRRCDAGHWWSPGPSATVPSAAAPHPLRGKGVRVPRLEELLAYARSLGSRAPQLSLEIKDIPGESSFDPVGATTAEVLVAAVRASGVDRTRVVVQSFFPTPLEHVRRLDPELRTQFLTTPTTGQTAAQNVAWVVARDHDVAAPSYDSPDLTAEVVAAAHAAERQVVPYTVDTASALRDVLALGVDGVISNRPACLLRLLGRPVPRLVSVAGDVAACEGERAGAGPVDRPDAATCRALAAPSRRRPVGTADRRGDLRVIGIQYRHVVDHVTDYATFRTAMRCLVEEMVVPYRVPGRPTLVVFNEDIGLMTLATGRRGATVREQARSPLRAPVGPDAPAGAAAALGQLNAAYAPQVAAYQALLGPVDPRKQLLLAATDTFVRAFSTTFSDIAREYGLYVVAGNNQARYRATTDPAEVRLFADPDVPAPTEAYVATSGRVANTAFVWGPRDVDPAAPRGERNLLHLNEKVPLTEIELQLLALDAGPATGPEAIANVRGPVIGGHRIGIATSLPAFVYGYPFGQRPEGFRACDDLSKTYMACMDEQGVDLVVQDEANPGKWAAYNPGGWQPLEWMSSTWRAVADPTVRFRYNVTPHLVGNLLDLPFDGQSAITARAGQQPLRAYVGNLEALDPRDPAAYGVYAGRKPHFLALAPWRSGDAPRPSLEAVSAQLAPGSGDPMENDYVETAVYADLLPVPAPRGRPPVAAPRPVTGSLPATGGAPLWPALVLVLALLLRRTRWT